MIRRLSIALLVLCLAGGLLFSVLHFLGRMEAARFKTCLLVVSGAYFIFAALWAFNNKE